MVIQLKLFSRAAIENVVDGVTIRLVQNEAYDFIIPVALAQKIPYVKKQLDDLLDEEAAVVGCSGIESPTIHLILQWIETGHLKLGEITRGGLHIDALRQFIDAKFFLGVQLGDRSDKIIEYFKQVLIKDRHALRSEHVRWAYADFDSANFAQVQRQKILRSLQLLFAKALFRKFVISSLKEENKSLELTGGWVKPFTTHRLQELSTNVQELPLWMVSDLRTTWKLLMNTSKMSTTCSFGLWNLHEIQANTIATL